jgi:hypothetical protein
MSCCGKNTLGVANNIPFQMKKVVHLIEQLKIASQLFDTGMMIEG